DQRALSATVQRLEETARRALGPAGPGETAELDYTLAQGFRGSRKATSAQPEPAPPVSAQLDLGV
ncbi:MAG TPA: hypothetical protein VKQ71_15125, partial [Acidimicrobiales bacterium]|nr:hypothetical protein [Acidimicrobiales bacterium]